MKPRARSTSSSTSRPDAGSSPDVRLTLRERVARSLRDPGAGSGPLVARLFHRLLALVFLVAWLSLGAQIDVLIGSRGLLPVAPFLAGARAEGLSLHALPTVLRWGASDAALHAWIGIGAGLAVAALLGVAPRLSFAIQTALYLSFAVACRTFLGFQWDNLLIECGLLAALLPRDRPARWAHVLFRVLLFKLYWESGLAKWQSPLGDWQDGSAMTFYYETAPLPTRLAHAAHALPDAWHQIESWLTLAVELAVPIAIFGPRRPRLVAAAVFTLFQLLNILTANYGFFAYLAVALHVFLLDERDLARARRGLERRAPALRRLRARARWLRATIRRRSPVHAALRRAAAALRRNGIARRGVLVRAAVMVAYLGASLIEGLVRFGDSPAWSADLASIRAIYAPLRIVNTYHLFAAITRERIEPEVQTSDDGETWTARDLAHKAGDPRRAPGFVAPHQPRVDFQLWFYGLSYRRGMPSYVATLLDRVCNDPAAVQGLFRESLPARPAAARLVFWRYHFTTPDQRRATGAFWERESVGASRPLGCRSRPGSP